MTLETLQESLGSGSFGEAYDPEREKSSRKCYRLWYRANFPRSDLFRRAQVFCAENRGLTHSGAVFAGSIVDEVLREVQKATGRRVGRPSDAL